MASASSFVPGRAKDLTRAYQAVASGIAGCTAQAVLDGEIVAVDAERTPSFPGLAAPRAHREHAIVFYAFDLLHQDGVDLKDVLVARRERLAQCSATPGSCCRSSCPRSTGGHRRSRGPGSGRVIAKRRSALHARRTALLVGETEARSTAGVRDRRLQARISRDRRAARRLSTTEACDSRPKSGQGSRHTSGGKSSLT